MEEDDAMSDDLPRRFEGASALQELLARSGSLADVDDVAAAFHQAVKDGVPAPVVITALWEDEPHFASPDDAKALFSNLLALYDLVASGATVDLSKPVEPRVREKATRPAPFSAEGPDEVFVEAAWRFFEDHPREYDKLVHQFDHRQDALVGWLEQQDLDDDAFVLARQLTCEVFAMLELGGHRCPQVVEPTAATLPAPLSAWVDEGVFEAEHHDERPLPAEVGTRVRALVSRACASLWA